MNGQDTDRCLKRLYSKFKASCKHRNIVQELDLPQHSFLVRSNCGYCGAPPSNKLKYSGLIFFWNGIDRINSNLGYDMSNVITCCAFCNSLKGSMKWETWASFINSVSTRFGGHAPFEVDEDGERAIRRFYLR